MNRIASFAAVLSLAALAVAQTNPEDQAFVTPTVAPTSVLSIGAQTVTITATATVTQAASAAPEITAVSDCHAHGTVKYVTSKTTFVRSWR
jgi:energy-converting hydrogenase Eha subunit A